jgi:hypothetical protein
MVNPNGAACTIRFFKRTPEEYRSKLGNMQEKAELFAGIRLISGS